MIGVIRVVSLQIKWLILLATKRNGQGETF